MRGAALMLRDVRLRYYFCMTIAAASCSMSCDARRHAQRAAQRDAMMAPREHAAI